MSANVENPTCPKCGKTMFRSGKTPGDKVRWRCGTNAEGFCYTTTNPDATKRDRTASSGKLRFARPLGDAGGTRRYIVTAAQNATPVHENFWKSLLVAAKHLDAELIVIPIRYKNPTSRWTESQEGAEWWADEVQKHLYNQRKKLNPNLVLLGDVKAQPTASSPLTGFEGLTGAESSIIGHTKVQLKVVPVPAGKLPKIVTTTGACTVANYTDSKAGKLGEFHHSLAAVLVEVRGRTFHLRQILADRTGIFTDLTKVYSPDGVKDAPPALGLVMGDTHARFIDSKVERATFGPGGIVETLNPEYLVWHDVLDGYAGNPHHAGNPFISAAKAQSGLGDVRKEVEFTVDFISKRTAGRKSVVVASNHDNFLERWVIREDWKHNPTNATFYLETALAMLSSTRMTNEGTRYGDPFRYWIDKLAANKNIQCLDTDESFTLANIECGMHGHLGPNGSRGNSKNLSRIGAKSIIGHAHTPCIQDGCYQAGTSTPLRLEYTRGPSSWLNSHVVVYASGKRCLITIIDGTWRLED